MLVYNLQLLWYNIIMITSELILIPNTDEITTEYIESEIKKQNIENMLRWAIVHTNSENLTISLAYEK